MPRYATLTEGIALVGGGNLVAGAGGARANFHFAGPNGLDAAQFTWLNSLGSIHLVQFTWLNSLGLRGGTQWGADCLYSIDIWLCVWVGVGVDVFAWVGA
jgi:hypothetical protein